MDLQKALSYILKNLFSKHVTSSSYIFYCLNLCTKVLLYLEPMLFQTLILVTSRLLAQPRLGK